MRWFLLFLALAFVATFLLVIGVRVSREGHSFIVGVACGAAASVPASLLALYVARRGEPAQGTQPKVAYPPLVIVNGPTPPRQQPPPDFPPLSRRDTAATPGPRYRVIGGEGQ